MHHKFLRAKIPVHIKTRLLVRESTPSEAGMLKYCQRGSRDDLMLNAGRLLDTWRHIDRFIFVCCRRRFGSVFFPNHSGSSLLAAQPLACSRALSSVLLPRSLSLSPSLYAVLTTAPHASWLHEDRKSRSSYRVPACAALTLDKRFHQPPFPIVPSTIFDSLHCPAPGECNDVGGIYTLRHWDG